MIVPARRVVRRLGRAVASQVHAHWRSQPIQPGTVLYESFAGNGMLCNPEAIFRALLVAPDQQQLQHIWVLSHPEAYSETMREFAAASNVRFVRRGSSAYYRALATSQYLINNATFPPQFSKRPGQVYVNTWHGTPLKLMGFDMPDGAAESANTLRNFVSADYLVSQSPYMTETMYEDAYKLRGVFRGEIIEEGHPRVDRQFLSDAQTAATRRELEASGLRIDGRKIIVYAPTWRGSSFTRPEENLDEILTARRRLEEAVDANEWAVLLKLHQAAHSQAARHPEVRGVLIPNRIPTNVVLGVTDALITDYSSIFFDFIPTGRPIVFFSPDQAEYAENRGLYLKPERLPGPVFTDIDDLVADLASVLDAERPTGGEDPTGAAGAYAPWDDGEASQRVIDVVFRGRREGRRVRRIADDGRTSLLLHIGGMRPNGITTSAFNLVNSIDHERFDVSVTYRGGKVARRMLEDKTMDPAVRHFPRVGGMNGSKVRHARRRVLDRLGAGAGTDLSDPVERALWDDEWTRCFGDSRFDHVVDFSGYGPFWVRLFLHSPSGIRSIWLHNDMVADAKRTVHGKLIHARSLNIVFSHYRDYDRLVSVSRSLASINRRKLADRASADKFVFAPNCIDGEGILRQGREPLPTAGLDDQEAFDDLSWLDSTDDTVFVTAGRLSPEKNHARLIRAFGHVHAERPDTRLVIIGFGPLLGSLRDLVEELGLGVAVAFAGYQSNPYAIMSRSDCFVLSSNYEGQPMVLLEAAVLGLAIVTVAFESVGDALPDGAAHIVPQSIDGLAAGLLSFLAGEVPAAVVDPAAYNQRALDAFHHAVGGR